jgi:hypothetical protein
MIVESVIAYVSMWAVANEMNIGCGRVREYVGSDGSKLR